MPPIYVKPENALKVCRFCTGKSVSLNQLSALRSYSPSVPFNLNSKPSRTSGRCFNRTSPPSGHTLSVPQETLQAHTDPSA